MMEIKKRTFVGAIGALGLVSAGLLSAGCSSSGGTGAGGTSGSAGASGGAGATGTGGTSSGGGTTGTGGSGGAVATVGCQISDAPPSATIADFTSNDAGGLEIMGGIVTYGGGVTPFAYTTAAGNLHITDTVQTTGMPQYIGLVIYFNGSSDGLDCIDASAYTGIQFDISGSLTGPGCSLQYSANDSEHSDSVVRSPTDATKPNDPKASGPMGAYSPQLQIASLMSSPVTTKVSFTDLTLGAGLPAPPPAGVDSKKIEGIQWQLTTPIASDGGTAECLLDLTIDNVKFYN